MSNTALLITAGLTGAVAIGTIIIANKMVNKSCDEFNKYIDELKNQNEEIEKLHKEVLKARETINMNSQAVKDDYITSYDEDLIEKIMVRYNFNEEEAKKYYNEHFR